MLYTAARLAVAAALLGSASGFSLAPAQPVVHGLARTTVPQCAVSEPVATKPILVDNIEEMSPSVLVQGQTLKTWDIGAASTERVQLKIGSSGRPIHTNVELWHTPSYIPTKFQVYTEDGECRPVEAVIETPKNPKTVAVYNTGCLEFPFTANVANTGLDKAYYSLQGEESQLAQGGGQVLSYTFGPEVESVQILLKTTERNMKAKVELTQGPNQIKQTIDVYASVGMKNPAYFVMQVCSVLLACLCSHTSTSIFTHAHRALSRRWQPVSPASFQPSSACLP